MQKPHATFDLETDPFKRGRLVKPFASGFFDGKRIAISWGENCIRDVVNEIVKFRGLVYAHNGGKFDFNFILKELLKHYPRKYLKFHVVGSRIVAIDTPNQSLRDSYAIIPKKLKDFAVKSDIDIFKLEADVRAANKDEIISYLKQDCVGLWEALSVFFEEYGQGLTLAGNAFKTMRERFNIKRPRTSEQYDDRFRKYFFGGRVEFFKLGHCGKGYKVADINSAYPWAMTKEHWFGGEYRGIDKWPSEGAEQCFARIRADSKGCLPVRTKDGLAFPNVTNGDFFATGWEIEMGRKLGLLVVHEFLQIYKPEATQSFGEYVAYFYGKKKNAANESERTFAKLFLNSYYGKLAQNARDYTDVTVTDYMETPEKEEGFSEWSLAYDDEERGLSFWTRPSRGDKEKLEFVDVGTAASITGCVRAKLMEAIHACRGVIYCDTDSIVAKDISALVISDELGDWKEEISGAEAWIAGKKLYALKSGKKWKTASKGVRLDPEQIVKIAEGAEETFFFDAPNYSPRSLPKFIHRTIRRADKRK